MAARRRRRTHRPRRHAARAASLRLSKRVKGQKVSLPERARLVPVHVSVGRDKFASTAGQAFIACATLGEETKCKRARNPRLAVGSALRSVASARSAQKGAFAGLGLGRGRRRRRRTGARRRSRR